MFNYTDSSLRCSIRLSVVLNPILPPYQKILRKALDEATHQYQINEQPVYNKQESMLQVISEQLQADNVHSYQ